MPEDHVSTCRAVRLGRSPSFSTVKQASHAFLLHCHPAVVTGWQPVKKVGDSGVYAIVESERSGAGEVIGGGKPDALVLAACLPKVSLCVKGVPRLDRINHRLSVTAVRLETNAPLRYGRPIVMFCSTQDHSSRLFLTQVLQSNSDTVIDRGSSNLILPRLQVPPV